MPKNNWIAWTLAGTPRRFQRKKFFFGDIDFSTSIHFISDFYPVIQGEFSMQQDKKI